MSPPLSVGGQFCVSPGVSFTCRLTDVGRRPVRPDPDGAFQLELRLVVGAMYQVECDPFEDPTDQLAFLLKLHNNAFNPTGLISPGEGLLIHWADTE